MSWPTSGARQALLAGAGGVLAVAFVALVLRWAPGWLAPTHGLSVGDRASEVGRVRSSLLAMLAGGVAIIGAVYTIKTFRLNLQGQLTERFTRAIDQLGSPQIDVRLGGIYALQRIARDSAPDHGPIMEILAGYLREHASRLPQDSATAEPRDDEALAVMRRTQPSAGRSVKASTSATDVQAALSVIARRVRAHDTPQPLGLSSVDLRGCAFHGTALIGVDLSLADLSGTDLTGVDLTGADMTEANLAGATLTGANLSNADLSGARLTHAELVDVVLNDASLAGCNLGAADLTSAYLANADLSEADLTGATLIADLSGADLTDAVLEETALEGAVYIASTKWPAGFEPLEHGAELA